MSDHYFKRTFAPKRLDIWEMFRFAKTAGLVSVIGGFRDHVSLEMCRRWSPLAKSVAVSTAFTSAGMIQFSDGKSAGTVHWPCNPGSRSMKIISSDIPIIIAVLAHAFRDSDETLYDWTGERAWTARKS